MAVKEVLKHRISSMSHVGEEDFCCSCTLERDLPEEHSKQDFPEGPHVGLFSYEDGVCSLNPSPSKLAFRVDLAVDHLRTSVRASRDSLTEESWVSTLRETSHLYGPGFIEENVIEVEVKVRDVAFIMQESYAL